MIWKVFILAQETVMSDLQIVNWLRNSCIVVPVVKICSGSLLCLCFKKELINWSNDTGQTVLDCKGCCTRMAYNKIKIWGTGLPVSLFQNLDSTKGHILEFAAMLNMAVPWDFQLMCFNWAQTMLIFFFFSASSIRSLKPQTRSTVSYHGRAGSSDMEDTSIVECLLTYFHSK